MAAQDLAEYFAQRQRECRELSLPDDELEYYEEEGSGGHYGHVTGEIVLSGEIEAYLNIHELVRVQDGYAHREEYAYFLIIEGVEIGGDERDPVRHPEMPEHRHSRGHDRHPSESVSFKAAVEHAWQVVSDALEWGIDDLDPFHPSP
jgi:hypothetical protein